MGPRVQMKEKCPFITNENKGDEEPECDSPKTNSTIINNKQRIKYIKNPKTRTDRNG